MTFARNTAPLRMRDRPVQLAAMGSCQATVDAYQPCSCLDSAGLSPRGSFLMGGWQIVLGLPILVLAAVWLPWQALIFFAPLLLMSVLLPFNVLGHVFRASEYAFRRWGMTGGGDASAGAWCVAFLFVITNTINLFR